MSHGPGHDTLRREINKSGQNCVWPEDPAFLRQAAGEKQRFQQ